MLGLSLTFTLKNVQRDRDRLWRELDVERRTNGRLRNERDCAQREVATYESVLRENAIAAYRKPNNTKITGQEYIMVVGCRKVLVAESVEVVVVASIIDQLHNNKVLNSEENLFIDSDKVAEGQ